MTRSYRFECTLCGDCCWGRQVVRLNKEDLQLLARHQGFKDTGDLFSAGLVEVHREEAGWRPRIRFRTRPRRFCPFLVNNVTEEGQLQGLCSLHPEFKPLVCHLAPLGRILDLSEEREEWSVVAPVEGCPGMDRGPVRSLIQDLEPFRARLDREKEFFRFLQEESPGIQEAGEAVEKLFTWPVL